MTLIYEAFDLAQIPSIGNVLLPGYPTEKGLDLIKAGEKLILKMPGGKTIETVAVANRPICLEDEAARRCLCKPGVYSVAVLPDGLEAPGVELGAKVYVDR